MTDSPSSEPFATILAQGTTGANYDVFTEDIVGRLTRWQSLCALTVTDATPSTVTIRFTSLPADMHAFVRDVYEFCPDVVDQGTGCLHEMVEMCEETGQEIPAHFADLIDGIDFDDDDYGLEVLKRQIERDNTIRLWWD